MFSSQFAQQTVGSDSGPLYSPVSRGLPVSGVTLTLIFRAVSSYVYLGAHNLYDTESGRKIIYTTEFIPHPDYDMENIANDVSLVRLPAGSVTEYTGRDSPHICNIGKSLYHCRSHQACLPAAQGVRRGRTRRHQPVRRGLGEDQQPSQHLAGPQPAGGEDHLQQSGEIADQVVFLSAQASLLLQCMKSYGDIIRSTNICAEGNNGTGTCQGDSGSSLQTHSEEHGVWIQYGVVSFGASTGCGTGG